MRKNCGHSCGAADMSAEHPAESEILESITGSVDTNTLKHVAQEEIALLKNDPKD